MFLTGRQEEGGIWRFHTKKNRYHRYLKLLPDLDDISVVSHILRTYGVSFDDNYNLICSNLDQTHKYLTWIQPPFDNEFDCVVNANVLLYLGDNDQHICSFINGAIREKSAFSRWYLNKLSFYYIVSRAFENGIMDLDINKNLIIGRILCQQNVDGSFGNDLQSAFALNILHNFNFNGNAIEKGTKYLIDMARTLPPIVNGLIECRLGIDNQGADLSQHILAGNSEPDILMNHIIRSGLSDMAVWLRIQEFCTQWQTQSAYHPSWHRQASG